MSDGIDERDRLTFWRNWYEAIRFKPEQERLEKYDALLAYVFDGIEPEKPTTEHPETANAYEIVNFVRATVAKSRAQRANGSKTKAKRKPTRSQEKRKPSKSKSKSKYKSKSKSNMLMAYLLQPRENAGSSRRRSSSSRPWRSRPECRRISRYTCTPSSRASAGPRRTGRALKTRLGI